jgi:hypothetical protein
VRLPSKIINHCTFEMASLSKVLSRVPFLWALVHFLAEMPTIHGLCYDSSSSISLLPKGNQRLIKEFVIIDTSLMHEVQIVSFFWSSFLRAVHIIDFDATLHSLLVSPQVKVKCHVLNRKCNTN